jgi:hypothetical protein
MKTLIRKYLRQSVVVAGVLLIAGVSFIKSQKLTNQTPPSSRELLLKVAPYDVGYPDKHDVTVLPVSSNNILIKVDDDIYLLNANKRIVWHTPRMDIVRQLIVDSRGRVFCIGQDMAQCTINLSTGEVLFFGKDRPTSGKNYFSQIVPYHDGQYLVVESFHNYRDSCHNCAEWNYDYLTGWDGDKLLWEQKIPPGAQIEVWGNKILAMVKTRDGVVVHDINVP